MLTSSFAFFHLPAQIALAALCNQLTQHEQPPARRRFYYSGVGAILITLLAVTDFVTGLTTDFQTLRYSPVGDAFMNNILELTMAHLFVNMANQVWLGSDAIVLHSDIVAPMFLVSILATAQQNGSGAAFRPLLIGVVPNLVSAIQRTADISPHWNLWFRVALPIYSLRYILTTSWAWGWIFGWIGWHAVQFVTRGV
jgi:hypothetical protein